MVTAWYVELNGQQFGPVNLAQLQAFAREGRLRPDTLIRPVNGNLWAAAAQIPGLFNQGPVMPLPPLPGQNYAPLPQMPAAPTGALPPLPGPLVPQAGAADPLEFLSDFDPQHASTVAAGRHVPPHVAHQSAHLSANVATATHAHHKAATKSHLNVALGVLAGVVVLLGILVAAGVFHESKQKQLEDEVKFQNKHLPVQLDTVTRLQRMQAAPNLTCILVFVVSTDVPMEARDDIRNRVGQTFRQHHFLQKIISLGCAVKVRYLNTAGQLIMEFQI